MLRKSRGDPRSFRLSAWFERSRWIGRSVVVALFAAVISLSVPSTSAADPNGRVFLGSWTDGDYRYDEYFVHKDGKDYLVTRAFDMDGTAVAARVEGLDDDNPDPNDPNAKQGGDRASAIARAKQKGGPLSVHAKAFSQTLLGRGFSRHGKGSVPVWNPSDDQGETTAVKRAPGAGEEPGNIVVADTSNKAFIDKIKTKVLQEGGAGGKYLENSGIGPDQYWNPGDEGGGGGPQDNDGSHHKPGSPKPLSELGPKPEIINPPTVKSLGGPDTKRFRGSVPNATETNGARVGAPK